MSSLKEIIRNVLEKERIALIGYLPAGFPDEKRFKELVKISFAEGLDILEVGIPILDPYLDGQVIKDANRSVVESGKSLPDLIKMGGEALSAVDGCGLAMVYSETVTEYGEETFCQKVQLSGYQGVLVPNLKREDYPGFSKTVQESGLDIVGFIPADCRDEDLEQIASHTNGFLYMQGVAGSTGQHIQVGKEIMVRLQRIRKAAALEKLPVVVGFGIREAEDVAGICSIRADGAIIGTTFVKNAMKTPQDFSSYVRGLSKATYLEEN